MRELIMVALGGALGASARYGLDLAGASLRLHPTLAIGVANVAGSFVIGIVTAAIILPHAEQGIWRYGIAIGLLGGFTTFSTFSMQTIGLFMDGRWLPAVANVLLSVVLCLSACAAGVLIGRHLA